MQVKVINSFLSQYTHNKNVTEVNGNTVRECLDNYTDQYPELREVLLTQDGDVRPYFLIVLNQTPVSGNVRKTVKDGDSILILPVFTGG